MDDFRTLRRLVVGWLLSLVALIPMNAQNGNVLGQVIRLPKSKGNIPKGTVCAIGAIRIEKQGPAKKLRYFRRPLLFL